MAQFIQNFSKHHHNRLQIMMNILSSNTTHFFTTYDLLQFKLEAVIFFTDLMPIINNTNDKLCIVFVETNNTMNRSHPARH
jgi:hypothetical protein